MSTRKYRFWKFVTTGVVVLFLLSLAAVSLAIAPDPFQGTASIDGQAIEWQAFPMNDTNPDFFAEMHRAGKPSFDVTSVLYMKQDCTNGLVRLYGLIIPWGVSQGIVQSDNDSFVKIEADGVDPINGTKYVSGADAPPDGTQPEWAWGQPAAIQPLRTMAEFSFDIPPGMYQLNVHVNTFDAGGEQTSAVADRNIDITATCAVPPTATHTSTPVPPTPTDTPAPPTVPTVPTVPPLAELKIKKVVEPNNGSGSMPAPITTFTLTLGIDGNQQVVHISSGQTITRLVPLSATIAISETDIPTGFELKEINCPGNCTGFVVVGPSSVTVINKIKQETALPEEGEPARRMFLPLIHK